MFGWIGVAAKAVGGALGLVDSNETASGLARDLSSGLDMLVYTPEEKAIQGAKTLDAWLRMLENMKSSDKYRSITRRILAVMIVVDFLLLINACVVIEAINTFGLVELKTVALMDSTLEFTTLTWAIIKIAGVFQLGWVFCTIIVFYFGNDV